jgi:hypothetical protein
MILFWARRNTSLELDRRVKNVRQRLVQLRHPPKD